MSGSPVRIARASAALVTTAVSAGRPAPGSRPRLEVEVSWGEVQPGMRPEPQLEPVVVRDYPTCVQWMFASAVGAFPLGALAARPSVPCASSGFRAQHVGRGVADDGRGAVVGAGDAAAGGAHSRAVVAMLQLWARGGGLPVPACGSGGRG
ncbi:hypothetical protein NN3_59790 [Nocardia neocaledoniensis NBRC 108232]|nr:hypothetical protein NN3_59790 [Nocardia neocaledoniensis NBRC 108232]